MLGQAGDVRVDRAVRVRRLVAVVDVELAGLRVEVGDHPARLQRRRVAARVDDVARDDRVGLGEGAVGRVLVAGLPGRAGEVVGLALLVVADQRRVVVERLARVDDGVERLVVDVDQLQRVARDVLVGRDHARDLLALEADLVAREHGLRVVGDRRHPGQAERLEVLGRDHGGDAGQRERGGGVDRVDPRVGEGRTQDRRVHHPGQADVVEVVALAADEARVLLALQAAEADRPVLDRAHRGTSNRPGAAAPGPCFGRPAGRGDDVLVARAAADRAGDRHPDLVLGRVGVVVQQRPRGHQHPGRAEPALERVALVEALLDRVQHAVDLERLDGADLVALAHRGQRGAGLQRLAVHQHDAGAAVGCVAAPVRAGQALGVADEVHEQRARLDVARDGLAVDEMEMFMHSARAAAVRSARLVSTPARWRL